MTKLFAFFFSVFLLNSPTYAQTNPLNSKEWCASNYINPSIGPGCVTNGVPGPLGVAGAAAAFGYSRKIRKRIRNGTK
jgi:hypothetical protein